MSDTRQQQFDRLKEYAGDRLISGIGNYANVRSLLTFSCEKCSTTYKATAHEYYQSQRCSSCDVRSELIGEFKKIHRDFYHYDLSKVDVNTPLEQMHAIDNVVFCPKHGALPITIKQHLSGTGCNHCLVHNANVDDPRSDFINQASTYHKFHYRYEQVPEDVTPYQPIMVSCPKHGSFSTTPKQHLEGDGCPVCVKTFSTIRDVTNILDQERIAYSTEKTFPGCASEEGRALRFDLYIPQKHLCIEFDGVHHFQPTKYTDDVDDNVAQYYFEVQQRNDQRKHQYCLEHQIQLARIPFTDFRPEVSVLQYIKSLPDKRLVYSWWDFETDIENIVNYIKTFNYSIFAVYGVSRGGLPFSVHISNHFENQCQHGIVSFQRYDGNDKEVNLVMEHDDPNVPIFIIDDLISSGITMQKIVHFFNDTKPDVPVHPIVIFGAPNPHGVAYIRKHPQKWIVFPYEI